MDKPSCHNLSTQTFLALLLHFDPLQRHDIFSWSDVRVVFWTRHHTRLHIGKHDQVVCIWFHMDGGGGVGFFAVGLLVELALSVKPFVVLRVGTISCCATSCCNISCGTTTCGTITCHTTSCGTATCETITFGNSSCGTTSCDIPDSNNSGCTLSKTKLIAISCKLLLLWTGTQSMS